MVLLLTTQKKEINTMFAKNNIRVSRIIKRKVFYEIIEKLGDL